MVKLYLSYNPYRVETELRLASEDKTTEVSEEAALMWIAGRRMQRWLSEDCPRNFFDELKNNLGEEEIEILFSGTDEDMEELINAANRYMAQHSEIRITVSRRGGSETEYGYEQKIGQLQALISRAKESPYHRIIPQKIWQQLGQLLVPENAEIRKVELLNWQDAEKMVFSKNAWYQVLIHFPFEKLGSRELRLSLRAFARAIDQNGNREWDRERFMLICECSEEAMSDLTRTQDFVKKSLLEYGIYDLNVYLVPQKESRLLYEQESEGGSIQLRSAKKAMELYSRYYAGQYRLRSRSDALGQSLMEDGFVRDKDLFRNVERVMRSSREFEKAHDQQVFEGHEWVMGFLEDLEHWLDMESA